MRLDPQQVNRQSRSPSATITGSSRRVITGVAGSECEIQLISDGDDLAVIGDPTAVERVRPAEDVSEELLRRGRRENARHSDDQVVQAGEFL